MSSSGKQRKTYRIYNRDVRQWYEVTPEQYKEFDRWRTAKRKREQYHHRCMCPRNKWQLCDGMCEDCEFRRAGDMLSLDYELAREDSDALTMLDTLADPSPSAEEVVADLDELSHLLHRLAELMPEAIKVGILREQGLTESAIAAELGIPRTTLRSRLAKAREQLADEFTGIA